MARIRSDLDGSVYLHTGTPDGPVILVAGDEVPEGFEVGGHLLADQPEAAPEAPPPASGAVPDKAAPRSHRSAKA